MLRIVVVNVEPMRNCFAIQDSRKFYILIQAHVPVGGAQHDFHSPIAAQEPVVIHVGQEIRGIVEVTIVVVIAIEKLMDIECAAHADAMSHDVRML